MEFITLIRRISVKKLSKCIIVIYECCQIRQHFYLQLQERITVILRVRYNKNYAINNASIKFPI